MLYSAKNFFGVLKARLIHKHGLKSSFEGAVLLDVFSVLGHRGSADNLNFSTRKRRFQYVCGVHASLGITRADYVVDLVNDENYVSRRFHLIKKPQHSRFKLPAELRTRNESGKIHKIYFASAESVRNISRDYLLRKRFCNRGFSDTGLTYEAGIVLLPAAKYLYDAGKIAFSAYDPVKSARTRLLGQILTISI